MKKLFAILFSIFYFGFSSGMAMKMHYCNGKLSFSTDNSDAFCSKCGVKTKKNCCKTVFKIFKIDQSQKSDLVKLNGQYFDFEFPTQVFYFIEKKHFLADFSAIKINAPPEKRKLSLYISHCNFRI